MRVCLKRIEPNKKNARKYFEIEKSVASAHYLTADTVKDALGEIEAFDAFFVLIDGNVAGIVAYHKQTWNWVDSSDHQLHMHLDALAIAPHFQGKGAGKRVLRTVMKNVFNEMPRTPVICLEVHPKNKPALKLYLHSGFEIEGWIKDYCDSGEPRLVMIRKGPTVTD